jgi:2-polyprenyl-3-methyl-5-hydroxy-6-metoxy-1,4-benzoquinol methylase
MSNLEVYFKNHDKALRFPWSIYHRPLIDDLDLFLKTHLRAGMKVLVIGPGDFQEFELLEKKSAVVSILDIDLRVLDLHQKRYGHRIEKYFAVDSDFNGYPMDEEYDFVYAKEVIEHIVEYEKFLKAINKILKPGGHLWLSTPNYGYFLLPLLESTVLEVFARFSGFSRKHIHPTRLSRSSLFDAIIKIGLQKCIVKETFLRLALVAHAKKRDVSEI